MKEQFRIRAKSQIIKAVEQRLFLIRNGKSKNYITHETCCQVRNELSLLNSNNQLAHYVMRKKELILNIIAANNHIALNNFSKLAEEANLIINHLKPQQNESKQPA